MLDCFVMAYLVSMELLDIVAKFLAFFLVACMLLIEGGCWAGMTFIYMSRSSNINCNGLGP